MLSLFLETRRSNVLMANLENRSVALFIKRLMTHNHFDYEFLEERSALTDSMFVTLAEVHTSNWNDDRSRTLVDNIQMVISELLVFKLEYRCSQVLQQKMLSSEAYFQTISAIISDRDSQSYLLESAVAILNTLQQYMVRCCLGIVKQNEL